MSIEQIQKLLVAAQGHSMEARFKLALATGMRRGELLALRWSNIDFERRTALVLHTVDYIPHYGYVETEPKTRSGRRLISLPVVLLEALARHRVEQARQRSEAGSTWEDRNLVFPNLHGGYFHPNHFLELFREVLQDAGVPPMHFHDLRHSAATILLSMGVNVKVIQALLGHSNISITLGLYSHLLPSMQEEVADTWDSVFGNAGEEEGRT